jgi:hypothetical protein
VEGWVTPAQFCLLVSALISTRSAAKPVYADEVFQPEVFRIGKILYDANPEKHHPHLLYE